MLLPCNMQDNLLLDEARFVSTKLIEYSAIIMPVAKGKWTQVYSAVDNQALLVVKMISKYQTINASMIKNKLKQK